ncbi:hypothetical protein [Desulfovibrio desulfuricans]|uniref:hypothetical protein n=1 Tax=Desulfovibrio desulfuricans TaxID=876 RepID=UPI0003B4CAB7|nr:hypothetical protein [Desulfovibrio desulfuricans]
MTLTIVALLFLLLVGIYINARMRTARHLRCIAEEKGDIARASGMTASIGVFYPDVSATVVMGVSEEIGACYYRVLRDGKVINRSRINLANIKRVELLINGDVRNVGIPSTQATSFLKATDVAGRILSQYSPTDLRVMLRVGLRIVFAGESGAEKQLEITVLRMTDERHKFKRMELLKDTVWWVVFLDSASANARHIREYFEKSETPDSDGEFF